jgi:hypothetical protein
MTDQSIEDASRKEFEALVLSKNSRADLTKMNAHWVPVDPDQDYVDDGIQLAWELWQAARQSSQSEPVAELIFDPAFLPARKAPLVDWKIDLMDLDVGTKFYTNATNTKTVEKLEKEILRLDFINKTLLSNINDAKSTIAAPQQATPSGWMPIDSAPKDNKRPLLLARIVEGKLREISMGGYWEYVDDGASDHYAISGYDWESDEGIENPTHWAYQDEPMPLASPTAPIERDK